MESSHSVPSLTPSCRQLPNMPREYITRLVFDPQHKSLIGIRNSELVIGVMTFRVCEKEGDLLPFIEVSKFGALKLTVM